MRIYLWVFIFIFLSTNLLAELIEHPFVVVIPSYNNALWCIKNIDSVICQNYRNYRVIYCDDCSTDQTADMVSNRILAKNSTIAITLVRNKKRVGSLANIYAMVHQCDDDEIVVVLDGDDWFAHDQVLAKINEVYCNSDVWVTYGSHIIQPGGVLEASGPFPDIVIRSGSYRRFDWITVAPRTFYAGLFKQIALSDLLYEGSFFSAAGDVAYMMPLLEMAGGKCAYIDDVLYVYNCCNQNNDFKKLPGLQWNYASYIRSCPWYKPRERYSNAYQKQPIVCIACVSSDEKNILEQWIIDHITGTYCLVIIDQDSPGHMQNFLDTITAAGEYVCIVTTAVMEQQRTIDLDTCALWMHTTGAEAFHFLPKTEPFLPEGLLQDPPLNYCANGVWAWQPIYGEFVWKKVFDLKGGMYRSAQLKNTLPITIHSLDHMQQILNQLKLFKTTGTTLCYRASNTTTPIISMRYGLSIK